jgi:holo-[acyl-carrier protein] synthase
VIRGVGIDITDIERIRSLYMRHGQRFLHRVFTDQEIAYCEQRFNQSQHFSARFAAKEAAGKALGTGLMHGVAFRDIEVIIHDGPPDILLHNKAAEVAKSLEISKIHLSMSHDLGCAVAIVIMESLP